MPNWCNNSVSITGPKDKIKVLWEAAQKPEEQGGGLLQAMHPMPEFKTDGGDVMPNWWNWRVSNWGTKWEVSAEGLEYSEDGDTATITGWFDSAWAPPVTAFEVYSEVNPDVVARLSYHEPGMCFVGTWTSELGDECHEYSDCDSRTVRDTIGAELDDEWNISEELAQYEEEEDSE
jgi:hypothetical protein